MALNPMPVGDAIAAFIQANAPAPGTPVTANQLKTLWEGIMGKIYPDITTNAQVLPGTLAFVPSEVVAPSGGGPCSGAGLITTGTGMIE